MNKRPAATIHDVATLAGLPIQAVSKALYSQGDTSAEHRQRRGRPTAVLAGCDEIAFGALRALCEHGLSAPKHVSLIGIDDHPMSAFLELTTISQPVTDQAALAASLLADRLQNEIKKRASTTYRLPSVLVTRKTTRRATTTPWATSRDL